MCLGLQLCNMETHPWHGTSRRVNTLVHSQDFISIKSKPPLAAAAFTVCTKKHYPPEPCTLSLVYERVSQHWVSSPVFKALLTECLPLLSCYIYAERCCCCCCCLHNFRQPCSQTLNVQLSHRWWQVIWLKPIDKGPRLLQLSGALKGVNVSECQ